MGARGLMRNLRHRKLQWIMGHGVDEWTLTVKKEGAYEKATRNLRNETGCPVIYRNIMQRHVHSQVQTFVAIYIFDLV